jgi:hypothetical protein
MTGYRGPLLIHAAKGVTPGGYRNAAHTLQAVGGTPIKLPRWSNSTVVASSAKPI